MDKYDLFKINKIIRQEITIIKTIISSDMRCLFSNRHYKKFDTCLLSFVTVNNTTFNFIEVQGALIFKHFGQR